jgi:hypothetical protein
MGKQMLQENESGRRAWYLRPSSTGNDSCKIYSGLLTYFRPVVQEAMNYHSIKELQAYFDSASAIVYEAFPKAAHGDYLSKEQRGACLSYIPHGAHLSFQFSRQHRVGARGELRGYAA